MQSDSCRLEQCPQKQLTARSLPLLLLLRLLGRSRAHYETDGRAALMAAAQMIHSSLALISGHSSLAGRRLASRAA